MGQRTHSRTALPRRGMVIRPRAVLMAFGLWHHNTTLGGRAAGPGELNGPIRKLPPMREEQCAVAEVLVLPLIFLKRLDVTADLAHRKVTS